MEDFYGENRMDTLPCLREQNEVADTGRYRIENFPLYCLKCKQESLIEAKDLQVTVIKWLEAKTHKRLSKRQSMN